jgi:hypothetical protein
MKLYHGSKQIFDKFDHKFENTGEKADRDVFGFWFTDNIFGAGNHAALKVKGDYSKSVVYVCEIPPDAPVLTRGVPVAEQEHYPRWNSELPFSISAFSERHDWFESMYCSQVYQGENYTDKQRLHTLYKAGFSAIHDFEPLPDNYLHGPSTVVMDVDAITILDIIHVDSAQYKQLKNNYLIDRNMK